MAPPRCYWHVVWRIARDPALPHDRIERRRTFERAKDAGAQVRALRRWLDTHAELVGVWVVSGHDGDGLLWEPVDPSELPVTPEVEDRYAVLDSQHGEGAAFIDTPGRTYP